MKDEHNYDHNLTVKREDKFFTKDKICFFLIGLLLGAVIASGAFLIYSNIANNNQSSQMPGASTPPNMSDGGTPPSMPDGSTPPEMPDGETPPELPEGETPTDSGTSSTGNSKSRPARPNTKSNSTDTDAS